MSRKPKETLSLPLSLLSTSGWALLLMTRKSLNAPLALFGKEELGPGIGGSGSIIRQYQPTFASSQVAQRTSATNSTFDIT